MTCNIFQTPYHESDGVSGMAGVPPLVTVFVLLTGVLGGLVVVISVLVCCKYCVRNRMSMKR